MYSTTVPTCSHSVSSITNTDSALRRRLALVCASRYAIRRSLTAASDQGDSDRNRDQFVLSALSTILSAIWAKLLLSNTINPVTYCLKCSYCRRFSNKSRNAPAWLSTNGAAWIIGICMAHCLTLFLPTLSLIILSCRQITTVELYCAEYATVMADCPSAPDIY